MVRIKSTFSFSYERGVMLTTIYDLETYSAIAQIVRDGGRWRKLGTGATATGPFIAKRAILPIVFEYESPLKDGSIEFMEEYLDQIGRLVDSAYLAIRKGIENQASISFYEQPTTVEAISRIQNPPKTYVYLMKHNNGLVKIGASKNPALREKTLQAEDPRLEMLFCGEAHPQVEKRLHKIFDSVRVRGEWFDLLPHHIEWVQAVLRRRQ